MRKRSSRKLAPGKQYSLMELRLLAPQKKARERGFSASDNYRLSSSWGGRRAFGLLKDI